MAKKRASGGHFLVSLLLFTATAGLAVLLLLLTAVVCLSRLLHSFVGSTLIFGILFAGAAVLIYYRSLRSSMARIREQVETVYEVARVAHDIYAWVMDKLHWIWALFRAGSEP